MTSGHSGGRGGTRSTGPRKPVVYTWQGSTPPSLESVRLLVSDNRMRASGRFIAAASEDTEAFSVSFEAAVDKGEEAGRLLLRTTTAEDERQISLSRTEDGVWLIDHGHSSSRDEFDGSVNVDVAGAVTFNSLPIRRLGLHRVAGEFEMPVVCVSVPDLTVSLVRQTYRTVSVGDDGAVITFQQGDFTADLTVDADGIVVDYPGIARRL